MQENKNIKGYGAWSIDLPFYILLFCKKLKSSENKNEYCNAKPECEQAKIVM